MPFARTWDAAYEAMPADSEDINLGATRIRNLKVDIQERMAVNHSWAGDLSDGKHMALTLVAQGGAPVIGGTDAGLYGMQVAANTELFYKDSHGNIIQMTSAGSPVAPGVVVGNLEVTGNVDVDSNLNVDGGASIGVLTVGASLTLNSTAIANVANDAQMYWGKDGSNNPIINFDVNTYLIFNRGTSKFAFVVGGMVVAQWP